MERLPLPLVSLIMEFGMYRYNDDLVPVKRILHSNTLKSVALVCKAWNTVCRELMNRYCLTTLTLTFKTGSQSELLEIHNRVVTRGPRIRDLRVCIGELTAARGYVNVFKRVESVCSEEAPRLDRVKINWDTMLKFLPELRRLDLSVMPLGSPHVVKLVVAAAKHCPKLEALVLPGRHWPESRLESPDSAHVGPILRAVYAGLSKWSRLRQLTVPTLDEDGGLGRTGEFVENVVAKCPRIEYLDGYSQSLSDGNRFTCRHFWPLTMEQWERFCAECTNLREFNWVVAPFGDPFFRAFGAHVKPHLKKLAFGVNMLWDWEQYFRYCDLVSGVSAAANSGSESAYVRPGYGFLAAEVASALKGCPALQKLRVCLYHPVEVDPEVYVHPDEFHPDEIPPETMVNKEIFDDHFCEIAATYCPQISYFVVKEVTRRMDPTPLPIKAFTDAGLVSLAKLKLLSTLRLRPISCTGKGLFAFLNGLSNEFVGQRLFELTLGGGCREAWIDFYASLEELLELLATTSPEELHCTRQKFLLYVSNSKACRVEAEWSKSYIENVERYIKRIKEVHPSLLMRIVMYGRSKNGFECISEYGIYTAHANIPAPYTCWDDDESDRDVSFINHPGGGLEHWGSSDSEALDEEEGWSDDDY